LIPPPAAEAVVAAELPAPWLGVSPAVGEYPRDDLPGEFRLGSYARGRPLCDYLMKCNAIRYTSRP